MVTIQAEVWILLACVVLSAFFSCAETTLTTLSAFRLTQLIEQNPRSGQALRLWETNHASVLATILIGNTIVSITAGSLATDLASHYLALSTGVPLAIGAMTALMLVERPTPLRPSRATISPGCTLKLTPWRTWLLP